tara:strand:- start:386 stop:511 length:126 start_codon:yes stop_codon:yes gene_type:complete
MEKEFTTVKIEGEELKQYLMARFNRTEEEAIQIIKENTEEA